jgi:hypothetical protein
VSIDSTELAQLVASFMDDLEKDYGEDAVLEDAVIAVEISSTDDEGDDISTVEARSIGKRNTVAIGIAERALDAMRD